MGDVRLVLGTPPDDHLHNAVHHLGGEYLRVHTHDHRLGGIREQPGKVTGNGFTTYGINDNATSLFSTLSLPLHSWEPRGPEQRYPLLLSLTATLLHFILHANLPACKDRGCRLSSRPASHRINHPSTTHCPRRLSLHRPSFAACRFQILSNHSDRRRKCINHSASSRLLAHHPSHPQSQSKALPCLQPTNIMIASSPPPPFPPIDR